MTKTDNEKKQLGGTSYKNSKSKKKVQEKGDPVDGKIQQSIERESLRAGDNRYSGVDTEYQHHDGNHDRNLVKARTSIRHELQSQATASRRRGQGRSGAGVGRRTLSVFYDFQYHL